MTVRISFTLSQSDVYVPSYSVQSRERETDLRYMKLFTSSRFLPFILICLLKPSGLCFIVFVLLRPLSILYLVQVVSILIKNTTSFFFLFSINNNVLFEAKIDNYPSPNSSSESVPSAAIGKDYTPDLVV